MSTGNAWVWLAGRCLLKLSGHVQYSLKHNLTLQTMLHLFYEAGYSLAEQGHIKLDGVRAIWYHPLFWTLQFASPSEVSPLKVILNWSTALCHSYSWHIYKFGHELINILIFRKHNSSKQNRVVVFFFRFIFIHTFHIHSRLCFSPTHLSHIWVRKILFWGVHKFACCPDLKSTCQLHMDFPQPQRKIKINLWLFINVILYYEVFSVTVN